MKNRFPYERAILEYRKIRALGGIRESYHVSRKRNASFEDRNEQNLSF